MINNILHDDLMIIKTEENKYGQLEDLQSISTKGNVNFNTTRTITSSNKENLKADAEITLKKDVEVQMGFKILYKDFVFVVRKVEPVRNKLTGALLYVLVVVSNV